MWTIIRVDGRSFSKLTEYLKKPYDDNFHRIMNRTAEHLVTEFQGIYCHTHSDEISVLFPPNWDMFDREVEKIVSTTAGLASAAYSINAAKLATFDSRIWIGASLDRVIDYFSWRQTDTWRNALQGYCYWKLREKHSAREATSIMRNKSTSAINETLFKLGVNINDTTTWHRRGTALYWETYSKEGYNPQKNEAVLAFRRRIKFDEELPMRQAYRNFLTTLIEDCTR